jgi:alpha-beta hydrolase superfamily lysophospholipase
MRGYRRARHTVPSATRGILLDTVVHHGGESRGPAPLAVCVHGIGTTLAAWDPVARMLVEQLGYVVACFTLRGHAGSGGVLQLSDPPVRDIDTVARAVTRRYAPLVHERDALLVGLSLGGWYCRRAIHGSERFSRLVLLNPLLDARSLVPLEGAVVAAGSYAARVLPVVFGEVLASLLDTWTYPGTSERRLLANTQATRHPVTVPVLYVANGCDGVVSNADVYADYRRCTHPSTRLLVLPGRQHAQLPPTGVVGSLRAWLRAGPQGGGLLLGDTGRLELTRCTAVATADVDCRATAVLPVLLELPLLWWAGLGWPVVSPGALRYSPRAWVCRLDRREYVLGGARLSCEVLRAPATAARVHVYLVLERPLGACEVLGVGAVALHTHDVPPGVWVPRVVEFSFPVVAAGWTGGGAVWLLFNRVRLGARPASTPLYAPEQWGTVRLRNCVCTLPVYTGAV